MCMHMCICMALSVCVCGAAKNFVLHYNFFVFFFLPLLGHAKLCNVRVCHIKIIINGVQTSNLYKKLSKNKLRQK